ncbi:hypothetical protein PHET_00836 [Paragonimus heterotremus]|uniref:alkaline phosphatase n=1 Tax=Paragonimus heterotremus TaxID=100268 RepID=A0A8J4SUL0_9TREM|nr:hypothetical protein PHET_00836 [Paragonimus heterotremus]
MKLWLTSPVVPEIPDEVFQPLTWEKAATEQFHDFQQSSVYGPVYNRISPPKNMIIFIGDGMSSSTITGARYLKAANMNKSAGEVVLDWELWPTVSLVHTFSANRMTTDSAAAATALFCGSKVAQSVVGLSGVKECCTCEPSDSAQKLQSILIQAQKKGLSVGIVTTTRITHATPAATYAHSTDRNQENQPKVSSSNSSFVCDDIASQLIDKGLDFKVILGGGARHFYQNVSDVTPKTPGSRTDGKNLFKQWLSEQRKRNRRHALVFNPYELRRLNLNKVDYLFGLLAPSHLDFDIRRTDQPSLSEMTQIAVKVLSRNPKGYLLLVESGRIDHGHHTNQAKYALTETLALERAVNSTIGLVDTDRTLVLVTADHSHGYGVIGYANRRTNVLGLDDSQLADDGHPYLISDYFSGPGASSGKPRETPSVGRTFENGYRQQALIPLRRGVHAADDVPLYATGPFNQLFHRPVDNTFVAYATMFSLCLGPYTNEPHCFRQNATFSTVIGLARADDVSDESMNYATWKNAANEQIRDFQQSPIYGPVYNKIRPPKNMILFVGDGLSSSTITGARYLKAANMNKSAGEVVLDWELWPIVSLVHTFSANSMTTESAAAATALFCGTKTVQYILGLTGVKVCCTCKRFDSSQQIKSTLIHAQKNGLSTGIVTTTRITHATPAACYAHSRDRNHEADLVVSPSDSSFVCDDIASQLINNGLDFNVILGGGSRMFYQNVSAVTPKTPGSRKDGRNLFQQWLREQQKRNRRHKLVFDSEKLKRLDLAEVDYLFGLLAPNHLDYEINRTDQPSLSELTQMAIKILSRNPKGYLLLVEGGRIDHGHHSNQAKYALTETLALEQAVSSAMRRVNLNDTLMVVTADHSHAYGVVGEANRRRHILDLDNSQLANDGYPYLISAYFNGPAGSVKEPRRDPSNDQIFQDGYRQQALVPLASATHAADDVPLYAIGPLNQLFHRAVDNTYVAHATMFALCLEEYKEEPHCVRINISSKRNVCQYQLLILIGSQFLLTSVM